MLVLVIGCEGARLVARAIGLDVWPAWVAGDGVRAQRARDQPGRSAQRRGAPDRGPALGGAADRARAHRSTARAQGRAVLGGRVPVQRRRQRDRHRGRAAAGGDPDRLGRTARSGALVPPRLVDRLPRGHQPLVGLLAVRAGTAFPAVLRLRRGRQDHHGDHGLPGGAARHEQLGELHLPRQPAELAGRLRLRDAAGARRAHRPRRRARRARPGHDGPTLAGAARGSRRPRPRVGHDRAHVAAAEPARTRDPGPARRPVRAAAQRQQGRPDAPAAAGPRRGRGVRAGARDAAPTGHPRRHPRHGRRGAGSRHGATRGGDGAAHARLGPGAGLLGADRRLPRLCRRAAACLAGAGVGLRPAVLGMDRRRADAVGGTHAVGVPVAGAAHSAADDPGAVLPRGVPGDRVGVRQPGGDPGQARIRLRGGPARPGRERLREHDVEPGLDRARQVPGRDAGGHVRDARLRSCGRGVPRDPRRRRPRHPGPPGGHRGDRGRCVVRRRRGRRRRADIT